jgi:hypothetical protein
MNKPTFDGLKILNSSPYGLNKIKRHNLRRTAQQGENMKKLIAKQLSVMSIFTLLATLVFVTNAAGQDPGSGNVRTSITKVKTFDGTATIPYAGSSLSRNSRGIFWNISTFDLTPGNTITLWVVIFNNASQCDQTVPGCAPPDLNNPVVNGSLQYGGGAVVGPGKRADFSGFLEIGDNTGFFLLPMFPNMPNPAPGLVSVKGAEVHLVIRNHGPASTDPATLTQQLTTFGGGCSSFACANIQASVHTP